MSTQTSIEFLNENDPEYVKATTGSIQDLVDWEDENGLIIDRPGAIIECKEGEGYTETGDEYGGWLIAVADIPKDTTHIVISRG